ncbi:hypothetical protein V6N13_046900 [Hibiscus sabdariffa]
MMCLCVAYCVSQSACSNARNLVPSYSPALAEELRDGSSHQGTVTSMEPNESTFVLHSDSNKRKAKIVRLVDVPGHSRLQPKLDEFLPHAAGIVFVVDSLEFLPNCGLASERVWSRRKFQFSSVVTKVTAHSKEFIRKQMEKEMYDPGFICPTCSNLLSFAADISNDFTLGVPGEAFSFSQCRNKVTVAESSGLTGEVAQVEQFIRECLNP